MGRARKNVVSKKISKLSHEGYPHKQAIAIAINMNREGRLTESGGYRHVKKKREG
jgi:hypothetical protein